MKKMIAMLIAICLTLTGCAFFTPGNELAKEAVVRVAAGRILTEHPSWVPKTYEITGQAIALIEKNPEVTLAGLESFVVEQIPWDGLTFEEQDLLRVLISAVRQDIESYLATRGVKDPSEVAVHVVQIMQWINQSAQIRLAQ